MDKKLLENDLLEACTQVKNGEVYSLEEAERRIKKYLNKFATDSQKKLPDNQDNDN